MWEVEHIFFLINIPMYIIPAITLLTLATNPTSRVIVWFHKIVIVIILVWDAGMLVWNGIKWGYCDTYALCHNQNPAGSPSTPVLYWYFLFFGHIVMLAMTAVLALVSGGLYRSAMNVLEHMP